MFKIGKVHCKWLSILLVAISISGCTLYRPSLQQGNCISQSELDQLEPGMSKREVQQIMGTTADSPMFLINQWNYSYAYVDGKHRDQPLKFKTITLYFSKDKLSSYSSAVWHPANLPKH